MSRVFLSAQWRRLVMLNFPIDKSELDSLAPRGTEVDAWQGTTYISLVAFEFLDTRVLGIPIPFHRNFEEINLRFYVRRQGPDGWRRGVVFVREVVPKWAIAAVAQWIYNEKYVACPTRSRIKDPSELEPEGIAEYGWKHQGSWLTIGAKYRGEASYPHPDSQEEFITEHYWGYSAQRRGGTVEYRVDHPQWEVWPAKGTTLEGDFAAFYGDRFATALACPPSSAFVARGSHVTVRAGQRISLPTVES